MEEKAVLLQLTPGCAVIGKLSTSPMMVDKPEDFPPSLGQKSFPEPPPGGEGGEKTSKGRMVPTRILICCECAFGRQGMRA